MAERAARRQRVRALLDSYVDDEVDLGQGAAFLPADRQPSDRRRAVHADARRPSARRSSTFGAINLLDEDPPRVRTSGGYDSKVHDPRGRMVYAKALFRF